MFDQQNKEFKEEVTKKARKFAKKMRAPLIFCSSSHSINVKKIFQIIIAKLFNFKANIHECKRVGEPIVEYMQDYPDEGDDKKKGKKRDKKKSRSSRSSES